MAFGITKDDINHYREITGEGVLKARKELERQEALDRVFNSNIPTDVKEVLEWLIQQA
jgi:hypothetical protein